MRGNQSKHIYWFLSVFQVGWTIQDSLVSPAVFAIGASQSTFISDTGLSSFQGMHWEPAELETGETQGDFSLRTSDATKSSGLVMLQN